MADRRERSTTALKPPHHPPRPRRPRALHHARACVVASGTATVQAAVIGNPFVVVYRVSPLTFALAKRLVRYPAEFCPDLPTPPATCPSPWST